MYLIAAGLLCIELRELLCLEFCFTISDDLNDKLVDHHRLMKLISTSQNLSDFCGACHISITCTIHFLDSNCLHIASSLQVSFVDYSQTLLNKYYHSDEQKSLY